MINIKSPQILNPDEDDNYCAWKNDLEVWQAFTKDEPKRQGPAVYLLLKELGKLLREYLPKI